MDMQRFGFNITLCYWLYFTFVHKFFCASVFIFILKIGWSMFFFFNDL